MISIIVSTKNEEKNLERLLASIKNQTYQDWEVIVVDNNSSDQTKAIAQKYTPLVFNYGPERSAQRNFGAKQARGEYVLILDADMELEENVLAECAEVVGSDKSRFNRDKIGVDKTSTLKALIVPERSTSQNFWGRCKAYERSFYVGDETIEAARFFNRQIFDQLGGYDTAMTGPEDYDLSYRVRQKYQIGRIGSFIIHHEGAPSLWQLMKKKFYYAKHAKAYYAKYPGLRLSQGNLLLRPAFIRGWMKLISHPVLTLGLVIMRSCETAGALAGFLLSGTVKMKN
ncbi:glycosyltransferase [Candidatus Daviesbacteria bacterium]|nr:glycosyltransferase [Candidatus Daviesbacteria bacterium]